MRFTQEEIHKMNRFASEILMKIHQEDKSGKLLYLFCVRLCALSRLRAYRITMDDKYKFTIITEDEYKKLKGN